MKLEIETVELKENIYRINGMSNATQQQKAKLLVDALIMIDRQVKRYARSGGAFSRASTGNLARKSGWKVLDDGVGVITTGVVYGRIQEFGGVTKPHVIKPRFAKALAFKTGNGFASNFLKVGSGPLALWHSGPIRVSGSMTAKQRAGFNKQLTGMTVVKSVNHPGSRIPGTHYTRKSFEYVLPDIQKMAQWVMWNK